MSPFGGDRRLVAKVAIARYAGRHKHRFTMSVFLPHLALAARLADVSHVVEPRTTCRAVWSEYRRGGRLGDPHGLIIEGRDRSRHGRGGGRRGEARDRTRRRGIVVKVGFGSGGEGGRLGLVRVVVFCGGKLYLHKQTKRKPSWGPLTSAGIPYQREVTETLLVAPNTLVVAIVPPRRSVEARPGSDLATHQSALLTQPPRPKLRVREQRRRRRGLWSGER
jgi:hypothetical protein